MIRKNLFFLLALVFFSHNLLAVEGMWLPILLKKYNIEEMQAKGFKLTEQDIYDINQASLKDAVVGLMRANRPFHHFCTGELISGQGLLLTNHHCGYGAIQSHSSVENDYLTDGFWAMSKEEELSNPEIGVSFLRRIEDVSSKVLNDIPADAASPTRDSLIAVAIQKIEKEAEEDGRYSARVKPFFSGNEYYLSVYQIYLDVRLVGAPPSAIGKFGGDTDNWMWPRHTGDFSLFRIYADKDNNPADFSEDNVPYTPVKFFEISTAGVQKGDFTMVMGYPGTTQEYLPSYAIDLQMNVINPARIKIRTKGLQIMKAAQETDPAIRIKYASKVAGMANGWKKWIGENKGLARLNAIEKKQQQEAAFTEWVNQTPEKQNRYGHILSEYEKNYSQSTEAEKVATYFSETLLGHENIRFVSGFRKLNEVNKTTGTEELEKIKSELKSEAERFFKDYDLETGKKVFAAFVEFFYTDIDKKYHPELLQLIDKKFKGNVGAFTEYIFKKSVFPHHDKTLSLISGFKASSLKKLQKDPLFALHQQSISIYRSLYSSQLWMIDQKNEDLHRLYVKGLREMENHKVFFPDANSTFRIAYGQVDNYIPRDAVTYQHQTTLDGIIEKDNPDIYDYKVPQRLKELYHNSDYGNYANADGSMPVCFIASNHTTGGNSGSPVLNSMGQLIGINFDRNWEGTMSDLMYDPEMCRNIALDIRYILFIIDKFAGATHLIDELVLVKSEPIKTEAEVIPENQTIK